jgi:hypothetical protein
MLGDSRPGPSDVRFGAESIGVQPGVFAEIQALGEDRWLVLAREDKAEEASRTISARKPAFSLRPLTRPESRLLEENVPLAAEGAAWLRAINDRKRNPRNHNLVVVMRRRLQMVKDALRASGQTETADLLVETQQPLPAPSHQPGRSQLDRARADGKSGARSLQENWQTPKRNRNHGGAGKSTPAAPAGTTHTTPMTNPGAAPSVGPTQAQ